MVFSLIQLRGFIEQLFDKYLTDEEMAQHHKLFENLKPAVRDRNDAIFGYIIGLVTAQIFNLFTVLQKIPTEEELEEIAKATKNRISDIKSRIYETYT